MCETSGILPHYFHTMELSEILHRINRAIGRFEREAVEAAMLRQDEITPELLRSVRYARHRESGTISQIRTSGELGFLAGWRLNGYLLKFRAPFGSVRYRPW